MKYAEKLKDPRWQKLRLEIFERDEWICQSCHDDENTLVVHHLSYEYGKEPWEYPLDNFMTLCQDCHDREYQERDRYEKQLLRAIRGRGFLVDDLSRFVTAFLNVKMSYPPEVTATMIEFAITEATGKVNGLYWEDLHGKAEKARS